jgi:biotin-(acetyl-CoA carboxylase) ligase
VPATSVETSDQALWRALGGGERLWRATGHDPGPPGCWSRGVVVAESRASQFDVLREALAAGWRPPGPVACAALAGRGFHGQRGRPWLAGPGNLHLCAAFPEPGLSARDAASLPTLPAVAMVDAIQAMTGEALRPGIKWVNDVLLDGRKVGGVLTATQVQGERVSAVLVGIGLNLSTTPPVPPTPFVPSVGSLAEAGSPATWADAWLAVLAALGRRMTETVGAGSAAILDAYREASLFVGREVCVFEQEPAGGEFPPESPPRLLCRGVVRGIEGSLALVLEGEETPVTSGRLAFAEHCRPFGL